MPSSHARDVFKAFNDRAKAAGWSFTCGPAKDFEHTELAAALAVWRDKAGTRAMPNRTDLTARAMKPFLTHMSLLERIALGGVQHYRIRLHGSTLARYAGDTTGKLMEDCVAPERLESYTALYDTVLALRLPVRVIAYYQAPELDYLMGESLVAPLAIPNSDTPILLSVTYAKPRAEFLRTPSLQANGFA
jgi:hypothetical protein